MVKTVNESIVLQPCYACPAHAGTAQRHDSQLTQLICVHMIDGYVPITWITCMLQEMGLVVSP